MVLCLFFLVPAGARGAKPAALVVTVVTRPVKLDFLSSFEVPRGVGSGLIVSAKKGIILAPSYLVQGAQWIDVILPDGGQLGAKILALDQLTGLALLKTKPFGKQEVSIRKDLPKAGERVWLVGRPRFRVVLRSTYVCESPVRIISRGITLGSFFAVEGDLKGLGSAPLFDAKGRALGFALALPNLAEGTTVKVVPGYLMALVVQKALEEEKIIWPWLGLEGVALTPAVVKALGLPVSRGLLVTRVYPGSPAAVVGIRGARKTSSLGNLLWPSGGDVLVSFNGVSVSSQADLEKLLFVTAPGKIVELKIWRGKRLQPVKVYLGRRSFVQP